MPQGQIHPGQAAHPGQPVQAGHQAQLKPGETQQAQIRPQQLPESNAIPPAPQVPQGDNIQLNTNEILPNQPPAVQGV